MPKSLWFRLAGCLGSILAGWAAIKFMGVEENVVTAHILIIVLVASLVGYVIVHTLLEHYTVSKVAQPPK